jgi:hypothetical protein
MKLGLLFIWLILTAWGQTNATLSNPRVEDSNQPGTNLQIETNQNLSATQLAEKVRMTCINGLRQICGKILEILPEGMVVESGYTDLLRPPLDKAWLVSGSVTASRTANLVESNEPGSVCLGTIFLTDYPKSKKFKPKQYDYVIIEGYPAGQFTYTSLEPIHKTVRRFSAQLSKAVESHFQTE